MISKRALVRYMYLSLAIVFFLDILVCVISQFKQPNVTMSTVITFVLMMYLIGSCLLLYIHSGQQNYEIDTTTFNIVLQSAVLVTWIGVLLYDVIGLSKLL